MELVRFYTRDGQDVVAINDDIIARTIKVTIKREQIILELKEV